MKQISLNSYRNLERGTSYARAQMSVNAILFFFHQHGFENHISLVWNQREFNMNIYKAGMLRFATKDLQLRSVMNV